MTPDKKILVAYNFKYCESSCIGQTSRHLKTRIKKHVQKFTTSYISYRKDKKSVAVKSAMKELAIAEQTTTIKIIIITTRRKTTTKISKIIVEIKIIIITTKK